jgi:hypothetical protein
MQCLQRLGFPVQVQRWVRLMLAGTKTGVLYHGYLSPWFDVLSARCSSRQPVVSSAVHPSCSAPCCTAPEAASRWSY